MLKFKVPTSNTNIDQKDNSLSIRVFKIPVIVEKEVSVEEYWRFYFIYNQEGTLTRKEAISGSYEVGWINSNGYYQLEHKIKTYMLHNVIWEMHFGLIPSGYQVDHKDRNPLNNKIENLRLATRSQQRANTGLPKNSTTGFKGVHITPSRKYQARIFDGKINKKVYIGLFDTPEEAADAYAAKAKDLHGEFASS
jgi:hypothetical protein